MRGVYVDEFGRVDEHVCSRCSYPPGGCTCEQDDEYECWMATTEAVDAVVENMMEDET